MIWLYVLAGLIMLTLAMFLFALWQIHTIKMHWREYCGIFLLTTVGVFIIVLWGLTSDFDRYPICNNPLVGGAVLSASSWVKGSEPDRARFSDLKTAWTPAEDTYQKFLVIDLTKRHKIYRIATAGRPGAGEFVTEYMLQYSDDGDTWQTYNDFKQKRPHLFSANGSSKQIKLNVFLSPIIAQWLRIFPTRWQKNISLQVEVYGCNYEYDNVYYNGNSVEKFDNVSLNPTSSPKELIRFRFKTVEPNGVLMYFHGNRSFLVLQLKNTQMVLNLDLGSFLMSSLSAGNLLNDNFWHDVVVSKRDGYVVLSVDRVKKSAVVKMVENFKPMSTLYLGGSPLHLEGLLVGQNFSGWLENLYVESSNFIDKMKRTYKSGNASQQALAEAIYNPPTPVTFLTSESYVTLASSKARAKMRVSFYFRTYENHGEMLFHQFSSDGMVRLFLENGNVKVMLLLEKDDERYYEDYEGRFNDGEWHSLVLRVGVHKVMLSVDQKSKTLEENSSIVVTTGSQYIFGGGVKVDGFIGCMKMISIDGEFQSPLKWKYGKEICCKTGITVNSCRMIDRCDPNPCRNEGICHQDSTDFTCECTDTGYEGGVCQRPIYPGTCRLVKQSTKYTYTLLDVDGSGPLKPFPVTCDFFGDGKIIATMTHGSSGLQPVDGFEEKGSYRQRIIYEASLEQMEALINRSMSCWQKLDYYCRKAKLFDTNFTKPFRPYSWWVSRHNKAMDFWAGAKPGSRSCSCGMNSTCIDPIKYCNCDADQEQWTSDSGVIQQKEHLPVTGLNFGDTGTFFDYKRGMYRLGSLHCVEDVAYSHPVAFKLRNTAMFLPQYDMGYAGDISLEFRTTDKRSVLLHATGKNEYIKISLDDDWLVIFECKNAIGLVNLTVEVPGGFKDRFWHTVQVERNIKEVRLVVDDTLIKQIPTPQPFHVLSLTSALVLGATTKMREGFVGDIRYLVLNGKPINLKSYSINNMIGLNAQNWN